MHRFIFAFVLLMFSFSTANASGLLGCCNMGAGLKIAAKATPAPTPMPNCHEMDKKDAPPAKDKKTNHCLCASMCASKVISSLSAPEFKMTSFALPASYGEHDVAVSLNLPPSIPPPKI